MLQTPAHHRSVDSELRVKFLVCLGLRDMGRGSAQLHVTRLAMDATSCAFCVAQDPLDILVLEEADYLLWGGYAVHNMVSRGGWNIHNNKLCNQLV